MQPLLRCAQAGLGDAASTPVYAVATRDPSALRGAYLEKSTPVDVSAAVADEQVGRWLHEYCEERLAQWVEK